MTLAEGIKRMGTKKRTLIILSDDKFYRKIINKYQKRGAITPFINFPDMFFFKGKRQKISPIIGLDLYMKFQFYNKLAVSYIHSLSCWIVNLTKAWHPIFQTLKVVSLKQFLYTLSFPDSPITRQYLSETRIKALKNNYVQIKNNFTRQYAFFAHDQNLIHLQSSSISQSQKEFIDILKVYPLEQKMILEKIYSKVKFDSPGILNQIHTIPDTMQNLYFRAFRNSKILNQFIVNSYNARFAEEKNAIPAQVLSPVFTSLSKHAFSKLHAVSSLSFHLNYPGGEEGKQTFTGSYLFKIAGKGRGSAQFPSNLFIPLVKRASLKADSASTIVSRTYHRQESINLLSTHYFPSQTISGGTYHYEFSNPQFSTSKSNLFFHGNNVDLYFHNQQHIENKVEKIKEMVFETKKTVEDKFNSFLSSVDKVKTPLIDINSLSDHVYRTLQQRSRMERERRGF